MWHNSETITGLWHDYNQVNTDNNDNTEYVEQENFEYPEQTDIHDIANNNDNISIENESPEYSYIKINVLNTVK